ncbi:hypothetical protein, partial [Romboutsia sp.]|uniref:hypothetical protein n=1 Tax=Romboutsia sp. TaxID=1965302 RepID=UPI002CF7B20A
EQLEGQVDLIAYEKSVEVNKLESPIKVKKVVEEKVTFDIDGEGKEGEVIDATYENANKNYKLRKRNAPETTYNKTDFKLKINGECVYQFRVDLCQMINHALELGNELLMNLRFQKRLWLGLEMSWMSGEYREQKIKEQFGTEEKMIRFFDKVEKILIGLVDPDSTQKPTIEEREKARELSIPLAIEKIRNHNEDLFKVQEKEVNEIVNGDFGTHKQRIIVKGAIANDLINEFKCIYIKYGKEKAFEHLDSLLKDYPEKEKMGDEQMNTINNKIRIIRDVFKDENWDRYEIWKEGKDNFGIVDRNNSFYKCFDTFEEYFGSDFIRPMKYTEKTIYEYNQTIKVLLFEDRIKVALYYSK